MTLWHTIGLIWVVMGCYGRKPKFADASTPETRLPPAGLVLLSKPRVPPPQNGNCAQATWYPQNMGGPAGSNNVSGHVAGPILVVAAHPIPFCAFNTII